MNTELRVPAQQFTALEQWLAWLETLHPRKIDLGLDRIRAVLGRLGLSEPPFKTIVVGGTNGKGSCVAMLESICLRAGYRVGAFTSPHLWRFNERIRLNGTEADDECLMELFRLIEAGRDSVTLSYFEYSAVAAMLHFARGHAEIALMEVGLGGRLDAVNVLDGDVSLVVSVDLDHQAWLGEDRERIGLEKAGIFRAHRPAVVADRDPPQSLLGYAHEHEVPLRLIGRDFDYSETVQGWRYKGWTWRAPGLPKPSFGGGEQIGNAAACLAVVEAAGLPRDLPAIKSGLADARLPGRMERHAHKGTEWVFDVAHNPAAARMLARALESLPTVQRTWAVFAIMHDKDINGVVEALAGQVDEWVLTGTHSPRAAQPEELRELLGERGINRVRCEPDVTTACSLVEAVAAPGERVLVFGSFYMVGPAMSALGLYCAPFQPGNQSVRWIGV